MITPLSFKLQQIKKIFYSPLNNFHFFITPLSLLVFFSYETGIPTHNSFRIGTTRVTENDVVPNNLMHIICFLRTFLRREHARGFIFFWTTRHDHGGYKPLYYIHVVLL